MIAGVIGGGVKHEHAAENRRSRIDFHWRFPDGELEQLPKTLFVEIAHVRHPRLQIRFRRTEFLQMSLSRKALLLLSAEGRHIRVVSLPEYRSLK